MNKNKNKKKREKIEVGKNYMRILRQMSPSGGGK